jgi:O-antigen/teichoic acid export membrane protein
LQDAGVTLGGRVGALFAGVATQSVLAYSLKAEGFGSLALCMLFAMVLALLFSVGSDVGALYFVSSKKFSVSEGLFYTAVFGTISSILAMIAGWGLIQLPISFFSKATHEAFLLSLLLVPVSLFDAVFHRLLTAVQLFKHFGAITVFRSVLRLLLTLAFVPAAGWGVIGALLASIVTAGTVVLVTIIVFFRRFDIVPVKPSFHKLTAMLSYGARYYVGKISNMAKGQIGIIIVAFFATRAEIGWFAIATRLVNLVEMIPESLTAVLFPRVANDKEGRKDLVARTARLVVLVCGFIFLILAVFATPIVRILFSPELLPAVPLIRILAMGAVIYCMAKIYLSYLVATKHPGKASIVVLIGVVVNIVLLWWLLPKIGIAAAAWAMLANYLVSSAIIILLFSHLSGLSLRGMFSFSRNDWAALVHWRQGRFATRTGYSEDGGRSS